MLREAYQSWLPTVLKLTRIYDENLMPGVNNFLPFASGSLKTIRRGWVLYFFLSPSTISTMSFFLSQQQAQFHALAYASVLFHCMCFWPIESLVKSHMLLVGELFWYLNWCSMWLLGLMEHHLHPMRWYTASLRLSMLLLYEMISKLYPMIHSALVVIVI